MIISVHIPKTGGVTFRQFIAKVFEKEVVLDYHELTSVKLNKTVNDIIPGTRVIHGHFRADKYDDLYPNAKLVTWFRDPREIPISHYYYHLREPDFTHPVCRQMYDNKWTLEQTIRSQHDINIISHYTAKKKIEDFTFIGIMEYYKESIRLFKKLFDIDKRQKKGFLDRMRTCLGISSKTEMVALNVNPIRDSNKYQVSKELKHYIEKKCAKDLLLYHKAVRHFMKRYEKEFGMSINRD